MRWDMPQVPSSIVALEAELEKIKTTDLERLIGAARKNRHLTAALLLYALENPDVRSRLVRDRTFKKHLNTLEELLQSTDREHLQLRRLNRLPEPLRQFLIFNSATGETAFLLEPGNILGSPTVQKWLKHWANHDPAWASLMDLADSYETNRSESAESPYQLSPYGLTTLPLGNILHFVFAVRHRVTGDSVLIYAQTLWNQSIIDFYVNRIPERFLSDDADLFREDAATDHWITIFMITIWDKIRHRIAIDPTVMSDFFLLTRSWGPAHILSRALKQLEPANWPFHARTYRDTLVPVFSRASELIPQKVPAYATLLQRIESSSPEKELAIPRSKIHLRYPIFRVITASARATLPNSTYSQFITWLDGTLSKEQKPPWFSEFIQYELQKDTVIAASAIPQWGTETARALLDGWIWFLALNDEGTLHLKELQAQVSNNLDFFTFLQPGDVFELLKATGTSPPLSPGIILP